MITAALALLLPCPLEAGWQLLWQHTLPRQSDAQRLGGFSGMALDWPSRRLWLLSDTPQTHTLALHWAGSVSQPSFRLAQPQPLQDQGAGKLDGEALVRFPGQPLRQFWMASEGRSAQRRPAALLQLELLESGGFALQQTVPLPPHWQSGATQGLRLNKGPEALLPLAGQRMLLAAEAPLQQDPPTQLRLLLAQLQAGGVTFKDLATPLQVRAPKAAAPHWGLTALLAAREPVPGAANTPPVLALWRGYAEPDDWWNRLSLLPPIPLAAGEARPALEPLRRWDLRRLGLAADNWEALAAGPPLPDGRPTLLLASDDNFNPLQQNRLALLAPLQPGRCPSTHGR